MTSYCGVCRRRLCGREDPDFTFVRKNLLPHRSLAALHNADVIHGRPAPRDIPCSTGGKITFLDWESWHYCSRKETQKIQDFLLLLHGICRINYAEERDWLDAIEKGYTDTDKNGIKRKSGPLPPRPPLLSRHAYTKTPPLPYDRRGSRRKLYRHFCEKYIL